MKREKRFIYTPQSDHVDEEKSKKAIQLAVDFLVEKALHKVSLK